MLFFSINKDSSPIVEMKVVLKASSEKRNNTQVFPTPESPIRRSLNSRSYVFFAMLFFKRKRESKNKSNHHDQTAVAVMQRILVG